MLKDMAVKSKILVLSILLIAVVCIVAAVGVFFNAKAKQSLDDMYNFNLMATQYLNDANNHLRVIDVNVPYLLLSGNSVDTKVLRDDILGRLDAISGDVEKLKAIDKGETAQSIISELENHLVAVKNNVKATENLGNTPEDQVKLFENLSSVRVIAGDLAALTPDNVAQGKVLFENNNEQYDRSIVIFVVIIVLGLVFGIGSAIIIAGNIASPLASAITSLNAVADGDLTKTMPDELVNRRDEVGHVVQALNKMQISLRDIIKNVTAEADKSTQMAEQVQELLKSLNADTQDMSAITEEMANTLRSLLLALPGRLAVDVTNARSAAEAPCVFAGVSA